MKWIKKVKVYIFRNSTLVFRRIKEMIITGIKINRFILVNSVNAIKLLFVIIGKIFSYTMIEYLMYTYFVWVIVWLVPYSINDELIENNYFFLGSFVVVVSFMLFVSYMKIRGESREHISKRNYMASYSLGVFTLILMAIQFADMGVKTKKFESFMILSFVLCLLYKATIEFALHKIEFNERN